MIEFFSECDFHLEDTTNYNDWLIRLIATKDWILGDITYIFCDDSYLLKVNQEYLNHDYFTDIITFDYTVDTTLGADIFISIDRVKENAVEYGVSFDRELRRVMAHGVLHLMGYKDKTDSQVREMRVEENNAIELFHVEH
ncbi:rRNA maturation RNase YbeY [Flavobacterium sp. ASW18X]|uniref:rRNA maturation RNase YbeY n=1 Tax=Flavobacterium sp. ASW18X TaxID=2572595 RepID=UPI0010AEC375|nr:rRNA maturation RNase YbeY [Flavobacterium sp. ASW18X]TKD65118.1 rRNA maturation RNase YbeY [Flavobacterium sp. ASW18X]